jgi:hypothetical protein
MSEADNEHLRTEYEQVNENLRHYSNMRFAQMTLFAAITAGLWSATHGLKTSPQWLGAIIIGIGGVITVAIFWVMEERAADYWHHFKERAIQLESMLGYTQYKERPKRDYVSATNAVRAFYAAVMLIWIWFPFVPWITALLEDLPDACPDWLISVPVILSLGTIGLLLYLILHYREGRVKDS